ncbi:MAG: hypothetical protein ACRDHD_10800 [Candidatus Limnocylindria bacterium]
MTIDSTPPPPPSSPPPAASSAREPEGPSSLAIGAILIVIGAILFAGNLAGIGVEDIGWPFFVIAVGLAILVVGLVVVNESGVVVGGTITTVVGLILFYQERTDHWESWAYAWALIPAASGLGLALWGIRSGKTGDMRGGTWGLLGGLGMFAIGFLFFEGIIGISGERLDVPEWLLPAAVILAGVVVLGRGLLEQREPGTE